MNIKFFLAAAVIIVFGGIGFWFYQSSTEQIAKKAPSTPKSSSLDPKNATYSVGNQEIMLVNGISETQAAPGAASKTVTRYFGNEAAGDFNADGKNDIAFILTQDNGGGGIYYYLAALVSGADGYMGTQAVLLGDRIEPMTTEYRDGEIIANYMDRVAGEPMDTAPSVGVNRYFLIADDQINEVTKQAMGEAEARALAESLCIKGGEALGRGVYNENSKTWWFDANLNAAKPGCNPACVVSTETKSAEINWRCTGLLVPGANGTSSNPVACTMEAKTCPDGSSVGRTGPKCEFSPCPQLIKCTAESRQGDVCAQIYDPVCATVQIQCIKAPCNPVKQTFSNACEACHNQLVPGYLAGECPK